MESPKALFSKTLALPPAACWSRPGWATALLWALLWSGCASPEAGRPPLPSPTAIAPVSLFEQRLGQVVEKEKALLAELERRQANGEELRESDVRPRFEEIGNLYAGILVDNPDEVMPLILYGKLLRRLGERENAQALFMRANSLDPSLAVVKQQLGNYYAEEERPGVALALYLEAIALAPEEAVYYYGLGELLFTFREDFLAEPEAFTRRSLDSQMLEAFRQAVNLAPENHDFQMRYGEAFLDLEQPDWLSALAHWENFQQRARPGAEADAVRLHRARALLALGRTIEAQAQARAVKTEALLATRDRILEGDFPTQEP